MSHSTPEGMRAPHERPPERVIRRRRLMAVGALVAAAVAVAAVALTAGGPTSRSRNPQPATVPVATHKTSAPRHRTDSRPAPPRITGVARLTMTVSEPSQASIATGRSAAGQPIRLLPTVVRYPVTVPRASPDRFPLLVFSQGYDESAEAYSGLLNAWARAGYVVASPTYPLTDPSAPGGVNESDIVNHPADLRFVISALRAAARNPHSRLHRVLDPREIAVAGQSDGGDVSLAVAANSCCRDPAVKAAMILSGAELSAFGGTYYAGRASVPLLVTQGSDDPINVPGCSAQLYDQAPPPKYYLDMPGAQHLPPYIDPGPTRRGIELATIAFMNAFLKHRPAALHHVRFKLRAGETLTSSPTAPAPGPCPGAP